MKMHSRLITSATIALLLLTGFCQAQQQQDCSDTERRFEIEFDLSQQDFQDFSWDLTKQGTDEGDPIFSEEYTSLDQVSNVIQCLPLEECFDFTIEKLGADQFRILLDGEEIAPSNFFQYKDGEGEFGDEEWIVLTTDFGDCLPTCEEGEALLDVVAFVGESTRIDWRVEDATTGQEITACEKTYGRRCDWRSSFHVDVDVYRARECLSMQKCYRMVVSDQFWSIFDTFGDRPALRASFDGLTIVEVEGFRFEAAEFGNNCESCQSEESFFEFFAWRDADVWDPDLLSWQLMDGDAAVIEGSIESNQTRLEYVHQCIPPDACLTFTLSVPETLTILIHEGTEHEKNITYLETNPYRLSVDGILYADKDYYFGAVGSSIDMITPFEETTILGMKCTTDDVCGTKSESLFDLQIETGSRPYGYRDLLWGIVYTEEAAREAYDAFSPVRWEDKKIGDYFPDSSYHVYHGISKIECLAFGWTVYTPDGEEASYSLTLDGEVFEEGRKLCDGVDGECPDESVVIFLGGENCPGNALSAGAIAGIVIGSVIGVGLVVFAWKKLRGKKNAHAASNSASQEQHPDLEASRTPEE